MSSGTTYYSSEKISGDMSGSAIEPLDTTISCAFEQEYEKFVGQHEPQPQRNQRHHHHRGCGGGGGSSANNLNVHVGGGGGGAHASDLAKGIKACSQIGIMQPLEQLHTANLALGIRLERMFESIFRAWGTFVARHPCKVIAASVVISSWLALGVFTHFKVTTDPVDLWVPAGSQARSDMEYFNSKFWKFYRIEQVIIEPVNVAPFVGKDYLLDTPGINQTYGPVFNQSFLLEAYQLYESILNLTALHPSGQTTVSLTDICYKPLGGDCAVQSIFTYFQNNVALLSGAGYIKQISSCVKYVFGEFVLFY